MKHTIYSKPLSLALAFCLVGGATASDGTGGEERIIVKQKRVERSGDELVVDLVIDLSRIRVAAGRSVVCTPLVERGDSVRALPPLVINGRERHILYERSGRTPQADGEYEVRRLNKRQQTFDYHAAVPFAAWMKRSEVSLVTDLCGCGWEALQGDKSPLFPIRLAGPVVLRPAVAYLAPEVEAVKARALQGKAFLDFPVNRTEIHPDYRKNPRELAAIRATVDSVRANPYASITGVSIKGYASPEGAYADNARLAKGRAEALLGYIRGLYDLGGARLRVDYEPEDWEGLERAVAGSSLRDKEALLAVIRDPSIDDPDRREAKLKTVGGGEAYRFLLQEVYPALRHSDYGVDYTVRAFTVDEAKELIYTDPSQLSLDEMYRVAQTYAPGSPEYDEVFEIAVRVYPADPVSNLNAAFTALRGKRLAAARRYMARAEAGPRLDLARGILDLLEGRLDEAGKRFEALVAGSDAQVAAAARENLRQLQAKREETAE